MEILLTVGTQNGVLKNKKIYFSKTDDYVERLKKYIVELYDKFNTALLSCDDELEMFEFNLIEYNVTLKFDGKTISFFDENAYSSCDEMMFSILTNDLYNDVKAGRLSLNDCMIDCIEKCGYSGFKDNTLKLTQVSTYNDFNKSENCVISDLMFDFSKSDEPFLVIQCTEKDKKIDNKSEINFQLSEFDLDLATDEYVYNDIYDQFEPIVFNQDDLLCMVIATILQNSKK